MPSSNALATPDRVENLNHHADFILSQTSVRASCLEHRSLRLTRTARRSRTLGPPLAEWLLVQISDTLQPIPFPVTVDAQAKPYHYRAKTVYRNALPATTQKNPKGGEKKPTKLSISGSPYRVAASDETSVSTSVAAGEVKSEFETGFTVRGPSERGWTYHLSIIQHPERARACGFGNKDKRCLSPPPILQLTVRDPEGKVIDPDDVDIRFLVLSVDLWSFDGRESRMVLVHPNSSRSQSPRKRSSGNRDDLPFVPDANTARASVASSRPGTGQSDHPLPPSSWPGGTWQMNPPSPFPLSTRSPIPSPTAQTVDRFAQPLFSQSPNFQPLPGRRPASSYSPTTPKLAEAHLKPRPFTAPSVVSPNTSPTSPRQLFTLPPLSSITHRYDSSSHARLTLPAIEPSRVAPLPPRNRDSTSSWSTEASHAPTDYSFRHDASTSASSATYGRDSHSSGWSDLRPRTGDFNFWERPTSSSGPNLRSLKEYPDERSPRGRYPSVLHGGRSTSSHQSQPSYTYPSSADYSQVPRPSNPPRHAEPGSMNFSEVLVGNLQTSCEKLRGPDGTLGLYFFAQNLSVRTEGRFTLKFVLVDLKSLMLPGTAPNAAAGTLAEAWSNPFSVGSAKRFPGVIPATELTKHFALQGVRLSTRQNKKADGDAADSSEED
ncbi:hypothetical protein P7C73_g2035, partial [Tremellales sp. Uapishka_1]